MSILVSSLLFVACQSEIDNKPVAEVKPVVENTEPQKMEKKEAKNDGLSLQQDSTIEFVGAKLTGDHSGGFKAFSGSANVTADGKLEKLNADIDMTSIFADHPKLLSHLKSDDFFDVNKYATATFSSTKIADGTITGVLDLHGKKNQISFPAKIDVSDNDVKIAAEFSINRQLWGISYPGKPDDLIKDDVLVKLNAHYTK